MKLDILYVDNHLLALSKPAGVPVVPDESGDESLLDAAKDWCKREFAKPGDVFLGVVHRLDRPVSGVVLFARTSKAASRLSEQFRDHSARKLYWAISEHAPREQSGVVDHFLSKDAERNVVAIVGEHERGAQRAITDWRVIASTDGRTHFDLAPSTGRPHQLRVAMASLGCPLLGDLKYGAQRALPDKSVALHAAELGIAHPTLHEQRVFRSPAPTRAWWTERERVG